jgi:uncharacterized repeat protein (TIGR01451 family)
MRSTLLRTSHRTPRAFRLALAVALGAALGADVALAGDVIQIGGAAGAGTAGAGGPAVLKRAPSRLTLGLGTLRAEYQELQDAVARGAAEPSTFATQRTMAKVVDGSVVVDAVAAGDPEVLKAELEALGAEVTAVASRMLSARVPLDQLEALESMTTLHFAQPALWRTRTGSVTSQGDAGQRSDLARDNFGVDGAGSIVGVISDSFDCTAPGFGYNGDVATGDLPPGVTVLLDYFGGDCIDEGRAMAQIVHDVAPGAGIAFHTAEGGQAVFAQGIQDLPNIAGADIVVDDIIYFAEPMFQDGIIAQAVDTVDAAGVSYFSSAGNNGREAYEAAFRPSGLVGPVGGELHDFDPGPGVDTRLTINQLEDTTYIMQWQDRYFSVSGAPGAQTDLDICFYFGGALLGCAAETNVGLDPIEGAALSGAGPIEISIERFSGADPNPVKVVMFGDIDFVETYAGTNAGTIYGHTNAVGANAVGASAYFFTPAFGQIPPLLNFYSSAGNTPILFDVAGNAIFEIRQKPEFTSVDGGNNTFFGSDFEGDGFPNFFGTSASAPHAAAVAALMRELSPALTPEEITSCLQSTAIDILNRNTGELVGPGYDNDSGSGLIDADAAVAACAPPPEADLSIAKTDDEDPLVIDNPNDPNSNLLTYTVDVANLGPDDAKNVVVTDTLPAGATLVSTSGCAEDPIGVPTCSLGNLASGGGASYVVVVEIAPGTSGIITNQASVTSGTADPDPGNDTVSETTNVTLFGDQDGDGCIGRQDVIILLGDVRAGTTDVSTQDINGDGAVNRADARALIQLYTNPDGSCAF